MSPRAPPALHDALARVASGATLDADAAEAAFGVLLAGEATAAQIGGLLMALRVRGETAAELTGAARAMRSRMRGVSVAAGAIDVCGTGGDMAGTLNVSTAVAFVAAGAGVQVARHGNRAASSQAGGADVLAALGVRLEPPLARLPAILDEAGSVFLFAPRHHPGLASIGPLRRELGVRTIFNLLGPLASPAGVTRQLTGVFDPAWAERMATALAALGCAHSWVVHGSGLDELSVAGPNQVVEQIGGSLRRFVLEPAELGLTTAPVADIAGGDAAGNAAALLDLLEGRPGDGPAARRRHAAYRATVVLNAAAALVVAGRTADLSLALEIACAALDGGAARAALERLRTASLVDAPTPQAAETGR